MKYPGIIDCKRLGRNCAPILLAAILTGCADVELPEDPTPRISMEMTFEDYVPRYTVKVETKDGMSVREVGIVETYKDNNIANDAKRISTRVIRLEPSSSPNVYIGESKRGYAMDEIKAYAYAHTDIGAVRSDNQTAVIPGSAEPLIKETRFDFSGPTGTSGVLRIYGENFSLRPNAISLKSNTGFNISNASIQCYSDSIVAPDVKCFAYGGYTLQLLQYGKSYPFDVSVMGPLIDSISSSVVKAGEPLTIYYSNATPVGEYEFNTTKNEFSDYYSIKFSQDEHHIELLPIVENENFTSLTTTLRIKDKVRGIDFNTGVKCTFNREAWSDWGNCGSPYVCKVGNFLYSTDIAMLYGYNLETHKIEFSQKIPNRTMIFGTRAHAIDDRYVYVWCWTQYTGYLKRYDTVEKQWEDITFQSTTAPKTWFEDANTFRALKGNRLFTYHLDTNTWDEPEVLYKNEDSDGVPLSEKSKLCGTYNDHVYFSQAGKVYRYPIGKPLETSFVGKPNRPVSQAFTIKNDYLYFAYMGYYFMYLYKMPMSSLIEGTNEITCIGGPRYRNSGDPNSSFFETDTHYLMINRDDRKIDLDGYVQALNK